MSMSTIAFVAHALRPSMTLDNPSNLERNQESPWSHRQQLLDIHDEELRRQPDALVLYGPRVRPAPLCVVETPPLLQVPRPIKGGSQRTAGGTWHKRQLDKIEKQIEKYERKLEDIKNLGLDPGAAPG